MVILVRNAWPFRSKEDKEANQKIGLPYHVIEYLAKKKKESRCLDSILGMKFNSGRDIHTANNINFLHSPGEHSGMPYDL